MHSQNMVGQITGASLKVLVAKYFHIHRGSARHLAPT